MDTLGETPRLFAAASVKEALGEVVRAPFRLVPYFDAGVWGGQWMKEKFQLGENAHKNWAWGFDGVPEENSILLAFANGQKLEVPAINLVFFEPKPLLGWAVWNRFGTEFPLRFDFLDTIQGQNLSLQVHPTAQYAFERFGFAYTQEESYYILDVDPQAPKAGCYQGLKEGVAIEDFTKACQTAQETNELDVEKYVNFWPAKKHDQFIHPAGCVHASGAGCMVLEISTTPYWFTFKLWDWNRLDLDGKPRPIAIEHASKVIQDEWRTARLLKENVNAFKVVAQTADYTIETTGLHPVMFIETKRVTLKPGKAIALACEGSVNMLNLVGGTALEVKAAGSPKALRFGYAETFIVPAACETYGLRNLGTEDAIVVQARIRT